MRRALGLGSTSSASKIWSRLRKKLFAEEEQGEASATPNEAVGDGNDGNDEEENDDEDIDVPAAQGMPLPIQHSEMVPYSYTTT